MLTTLNYSGYTCLYSTASPVGILGARRTAELRNTTEKKAAHGVMVACTRVRYFSMWCWENDVRTCD